MKKRIGQLETMLEKEVNQRKGDHDTFAATIETEVQERIFHDGKNTTVAIENREMNNASLESLRDDMVRENEILR